MYFPGNCNNNEDHPPRSMIISNKINKNKKDHREKNGQGTFNIDQFPSLPQPALGKNGSIFDRDAEW